MAGRAVPGSGIPGCDRAPQLPTGQVTAPRTLEGTTPQQQNGTELGRFLRARRARVPPGQAGLPTGAGPRRTPGLRREKLATLTGISIDYYTRLERGKETRPSPSVIDALARGLLLEQDEIDHLRSLAALAARTPPEPPAAPSRAVRPGVRLLLESLRPSPAYVVSRTNDLLAANPSGLRLFAGIEEWPVKQRNIARYVFLHPPHATCSTTGATRSVAVWPTSERWPAPTPTPRT